jgi:alpha-beta hydrolase superfamily lysophospholipase
MSKSKYLSLLIAGAMVGCNDEVTSRNPADGDHDKTYLISADSVSSVPLETLLTFAEYSGQSSIIRLVKYGVTTYKVVYETIYNGEAIQASGLIYLPEGLNGAAPIVSLQHGTTFLKDDAPSTSGSFSGMEYFASAGYIAVMPDYIGYGTSAGIFHPYYDEKHSAMCVVDFIKAAKQLLKEKNILFDNQLFLAGYSEGGYVTLAAAQEIELNAAHELKLTAVAAGAGGYDLGEMLAAVTTSTHYAYPAYLAFVIMSYNNTYGWNKPLNYFFQDKYAKALETYMTGQYDGWQINSKLTTDIKSLLNPTFYQQLKKEDGEIEFKRTLYDNSVSGWKSNLPIRLYHGTRDEIIPYKNSEVTLDHFRAAGSRDVTLTAIPAGTHGSAFIPMLQKFVPWFESLRNDQ